MLSERIKELRKLNGYSQQQMAQKLHLTQGAISQWETGMTLPSAEQLGALADVFGITVDELLGRKPQDEQDEVMQIRDMLRRDPSYRTLFKTANKASLEHVRAATAMLKALEPNDAD